MSINFGLLHSECPKSDESAVEAESCVIPNPDIQCNRPFTANVALLRLRSGR